MPTTFPIYTGDPGTTGGTLSPPPASSAKVLAVIDPVLPDVQAVVIPLAAVPGQTLAVTLAEQPCVLEVYQRMTGLYVDLRVADVPVVTGVIARDRAVIVRELYRAFVGDLVFVDTQGEQDPSYDGLGDRYVLLWLSDWP